MSILAVTGLTKHFDGITAVDDVSFSIDPGEMLAIIGPNGAGKTTCFNIIGGQLPADSGRIRLGDTDVTGLNPVRLCRLGLGRTFQTAAIFASMSVRENVQIALLSHHRQTWRLWRAADTHHVQRSEMLLAQMGLSAAACTQAGVLAYGDLKRLELAVAMAADPFLLLMDEPTAGTTAAERRTLMALIRGHATARRMAVLFTEHDMDTVFAHADRVLVMHHGAIIAKGSPAAIRANPKVREVYLGN